MHKQDDSRIVAGPGGILFAGRDATEFYRVVVLRSAIGLLEMGIRPRRGYTMKMALAACERYTGRKYKRTEAARAQADLTVWIETMHSALPVEVQS
jgi:hypothetical protein